MKEKVVRISILLLFFLLFVYRGLVLLDPDFGWHIQMGRIILSTGIPKTDPFSYSMPSYPFVDHEWLTNVFMAIGYEKISMIGLAIIFSLLTIIAVATITRWLSTPETKLFFVLSITLLFPFAGVRTQVITWFFFSLFLTISFQQRWKKYKYILPFLMLLWVNMHGGFAIGIVSLFIILIARSVTERKVQIADVMIFLLCCLATFLNPYGHRIWWEVWMQMSDSSLHWTISEWLPVFVTPIDIGLLFFFAFSLAQMVITGKKYTMDELLLYGGLLIAGLSSIRQIPLWILVANILLLKSYSVLQQEASRYRYGAQRFQQLSRILGIMILSVTILQVVFSLINIQGALQDTIYPKKAVKLLQTKLPHGNIFSIYNWGGYLIWQLPQKKDYIDGRMPSWRWNASLPHETNYAFQEYQRIGDGKIPIQALVAKYGITTFLLPTEKKTQKRISYFASIVNNLDQLFSANKQKHAYNLQKTLLMDGFTKIYTDSVATIYSTERQ